MSEDVAEETPVVDARSTWRDDYEKLGSYTLEGRCINCRERSRAMFTKGYRPSDLTWMNSRVRCPTCGCDTMAWEGLAY
jgi:hypothetical protein